jgi:hypothetical protein
VNALHKGKAVVWNFNAAATAMFTPIHGRRFGGSRSSARTKKSRRLPGPDEKGQLDFYLDMEGVPRN